jgi:protein-tyrosine kinase
MSRIDEALARSRSIKPEELAAPIDAPAGDATIAFASEPASELEYQATVEVIEPEVPVDEPGAPRVEKIIEPSGRVEDLPIAEKLMLSGGQPGDQTPVEQYRRLAARLFMAQAEHGIGIVMVTSALPGEGKTLTATNLALTLSESYKRDVLLIDGDLRRPCVHQVFQVPNASGLNEGLQAEDDRKVPLMQFSEHLWILTAGRPDNDPMSVLSGTRMQRVLSEAKERFDWVVVDTPPVGLLTDAHLLSALVDVVLLIVRAGETPLPAINTAVNAVGKDRILGVVLNHAESSALPASYNYYETYRANA